MLRTVLQNDDSKSLNVQTGLDDNPTLVTEGMRVLASHWKSIVYTGVAATTEVIAARPNEAIGITDLIIILAKKVTSLTVIPRFSDGTNTVNLVTFDGATDSFSFSHAFQALIRGWKEANFQVVTDEDSPILSVMVGYVHISPEATLPYAVWNAER